MKRLLSAIMILSCVGNVFAAGRIQDETDSIWSLDDIPSWIQRNIEFPIEACQYGVAGVEQFVISATWDGRVFITSPVNTLHPAFEREIKAVVSRAPHCRFAGALPDDIYKLVQIDFTALIPANVKESMKSVSRHLFPHFARKAGESHPLTNDRVLFVDWLSKKCVLPRKVDLKNYSDTISLFYTIDCNGQIGNIQVDDCKNAQINAALVRAAQKSPQWQPAVTEDGEPLAIEVCDRVIINIGTLDRKTSLQIYQDEVCKNSSRPPLDADMIVLNPTDSPRYNGDYKMFTSLIRDSLVVAGRISYSGAFVIEKDGSVSNISVNGDGARVDSIITRLISRSEWVPARQGDQVVRSLYTFRGTQLPPAQYTYAPQDVYPGMMSQGSRTPFVYDPPYNKGQQRRWRRFYIAYPDTKATVYGYGKFQLLDSRAYTELMIIRGMPAQDTKKRIVRYKK